MIKAGITGSIGSGKTIVCRIFEILGVPVYYSDTEAKKIYSSDDKVKQKMISLFGEDIYNDNIINREKLAGIIFKDARLLASVNEIVHPAVACHFLDWCTSHADVPYVVFESAILFESGHASLMDTIATVMAPVEVRIARILERQGMTREKADAVIKNQADDKARIAGSGHIILNDGLHLVLPEVLRLHDIYSKMEGK